MEGHDSLRLGFFHKAGAWAGGAWVGYQHPLILVSLLWGGGGPPSSLNRATLGLIRSQGSKDTVKGSVGIGGCVWQAQFNDIKQSQHILEERASGSGAKGPAATEPAHGFSWSLSMVPWALLLFLGWFSSWAQCLCGAVYSLLLAL